MTIDPHHNQTLEEMDVRTLLHPSTSISDHLANGPRIMVGGSGVHVTDSKGNRYLDGAAGLWCVNVGYGRTEIADAIHRQSTTLPYFHSFTSMSNEPSILLADRVLRWTPPGMSKVIFGSGGSDANDTNVKIVWYYNNMRGLPEKKKILSRKRAYHGVSVASGSLTGLPINHVAFDLPLPMMKHTHSVDTYREKPAGMSEADFTAYLAAELEALILAEGPDTVAAFIAEPLMGTGGVLVPPEGYFPAIQAVLDRYDVLMIADEVICGFGRLGTRFGSDKFNIRPDIMTMAKGLSSGYLPISASVINEKIWTVLKETAPKMPGFGHGLTYSAHPTCAAAALANLDILERENLVDNAARAGAALKARLKAELGDHPLVGDIRGEGLMIGVELVADKATKQELNLGLKVGPRVMARGYHEGILVRALPHRTVMAMSPPLILSDDNIDELVTGLKKAIGFVHDELVRDKVDLANG
ncbi:aminotransferase [Ensifer soli]|uniref:aminotransferase n=1 Tax=Ciceribacter sp. sgz301302 TaxID=3342379 RepID=UPI0035B96EFA